MKLKEKLAIDHIVKHSIDHPSWVMDVEATRWFIAGFERARELVIANLLAHDTSDWQTNFQDVYQDKAHELRQLGEEDV